MAPPVSVSPSQRPRPSADARDAARPTEAGPRALFDVVTDALLVHDLETGAILDANRAACELYGRPLDELKALGVDGTAGAAPYDAEHARAYVRRAAAGTPQRFEWIVERASGERVWVEVRLDRVAVLGEDRVLASARPVDERKRAETALQEAHAGLERRVAERTAELARAEQRFRAIVEASPVPLLLSHATDGIVLYANDRLEALLGVPEGSLVGQRTPDFYHDLSDRAAVLETVHERGYVRDRELRIRLSDGTPRWVSISTQRLVFNGEPTFATALVDITERKGTEAALRERTEELEVIFKALPDLYFRMEADGTILAYRAGRSFGLYVPPEAFLGRRVQDVLPPPVGPQVGAALEEVGWTGDAVRIEYTLPLGEEPRHFEARLLPVAGDQVIAIVRDVTEPKRAEEAIRASEASYRGLFDTLSELVYIQGLEGRFLNVNEAVVRAYGYTRGELIGQTPEMLGDPRTVDPEAVAETFARAVAGEPQRFEWWGRRKDGTLFPKEVVLQRSTYFGEDVVLAVARDVTAQKQAEAALRASEEHFRRLIENASDIITILDADGRVWYQSPAITEILGYGHGELKGQDVFSFIHPDDVAGTAAALREAVEAPGQTRTAEYRFRHKDGSWRVLEGKGVTIDPNSADEGVVVNSRDVTERNAAEAELARQKAYFEEVLNGLDAGIAVFDADGRFEYVSPRATPDPERRRAMVGKTLEEYAEGVDVAPDVLEARRQSVDAAVATRTPNEFEEPLRGPDGQTRRMLRRTVPVLDAAGEVARLVGYSVDITERVEAERTLRFQKTLLEAQGEASIDGILVVSEEGGVLSYNRRFVEMWAIPDEAVASGTDDALLAAVLDRLDDPGAFLDRVAHLYAHPDATARDEITLRDGRVLDRYSAPVRSHEGETYGRIWFFRDMTAQKRYAEDLEGARVEAERAREDADRYADSLERSLEELRAAQVRLVQQEKMASLGRLTAGVAHEIRNPLNFVTNFAEMNVELLADLRAALADGDPADLAELLDDVEENARRVREHGQRANAIVGGMMEHARLSTGGAGPRRAVDVNAIVRDQVGVATKSREARAPGLGCRVVADYGDDAGALDAAPQEIARVVQALLVNALDAVEDRAATEPDAYAPTLHVRTRRANDAVVIVVADNGPGLADDLRSRVFEPFFTTKPTGTGHPGLGLSLAHETVVAGYDGRIDVESTDGEGATFTVAFPVAAAP